MADTDQPVAAYQKILDRLYDNATYSAQAYFEAAKGAEFLGKVIVFLPALMAACAGALVALDFSKAWGIAAAAAGLVSATGSFLGAERKAPSFRESARRYTQLRHKIASAADLATFASVKDLAEIVKKLEVEYSEIVGRDEPVSNRYFNRASRRVKRGKV
ncbi:hypothetical protein [Amycolatopsis pigmentata]|uniref:SLATT domain-containing protein n=1 Tax=Amycolatopsis pigmentata TaxID=450801 RepID=A0ABW5FM73_9PSEU